MRFTTIVSAILACALLTSCASVIGPRQVEVPLAKLQQGLERRFPVNNTILSLFEVRLSKPQLTILSDQRIGLTVDASISPPFIQQSWRGKLAMSGRLAIDPARGAVLISDARIERLAADGIDPSLQREIANVANLAAGQIIQSLPLYTFRQDDLRYAGVQFAPTRIGTTPGALVLTFEPVK